MNAIWSTFIQGAEMMYKTRQVRFRDEYSELYKNALGFDECSDILEIGCGPGALIGALKKWYPNSHITGFDRDVPFLNYAKSKFPDLTIADGDAAALPFDRCTFDAVTSHTVQEHVETSAFFSEQYRILKPNGICTVMGSRTNMSINPANAIPLTDEEINIWKKLNETIQNTDKKYEVCKYPLTEQELLLEMGKAGFEHVTSHFIAICNAPDNYESDDDTAYSIIEANRLVDLDCIQVAINTAPDILSEAEINFLKESVNLRYEKRKELFSKRQKLWDISVSVIMIARGVKK